MKSLFSAKTLPLMATFLVCALLYGAASWHYPGFFSPGVFINFFGDNAFLGIAAIGLTFVIISGGIDLSVGAMIGLVSITIAVAIERWNLHPWVVLPAILLFGALFGSAMGAIIHLFGLPPFLVTLAGMFLARGLAYVVSMESISISHEVYAATSMSADTRFALSEMRLPLGTWGSVPLAAVIFGFVVAAAMYVAHMRPFGRNVYAIGGNSEAALLMGLPVGSVRVRVYALSGFCSALAGIVYTIYSLSGNANAGMGLELDAIAAVVIGGTLLTGGVGYIFGTLIGVLISGIIQTAITFQGTLSSWYTKIAIGVLLLAFILLQKLLTRGVARGRG
jgi:galactofuranose transport system permease protein